MHTQVEKKLLREQAKEERRQKKEEEKISKGTVFDLINNKLAGGGIFYKNILLILFYKPILLPEICFHLEVLIQFYSFF